MAKRKTKTFRGGIYQTKSFSPSVLSEKKVRGKILAAMNEHAKYNEKLFKQTIATWNDPPSIESKFSYAGGDGVMETKVTGTDYQVSKWAWLDQGTSVRRAKLSSDWKSKTTAGTLASGPGAGRVEAISKNFAFPGIQARGWLKLIVKKSSSRFSRKINQAIKEGIEP